MIRLDATTRKLQAVLGGAITTNQLPITVCYSDKTSTAYTGGTTVINTNNTTAVDICAAPAASTVRDVDTINVNNADTVAATITIRYNDNGTTYTLFKATLAVGDQLTYVHGVGWNVIDSTGKTKVGAGVNGPSSSTDNALVRWDGTAGTAVQNSGWTLSDTDALNGVSGSVGAPSLTLNSETTSGLYRIGANNHGWAISGNQILNISSTGLSITGTFNAQHATAGLVGVSSAGVGSAAFQYSTNSTVRWSTYVPSAATNLVIANSATLDGSTGKVLDISSSGLGVTGAITGTTYLQLADTYDLRWGDGSTFIAGNSTTDIIQFATVGVERGRFTSTGLEVTGTGAFTGNITVTKATGVPSIGLLASTGTNEAYYAVTNTGGGYAFGVENSAGSWFGATAYAQVIQAPAGRVIQCVISGTPYTTVSSTGLAVTGALSSTGDATLGTTGNGASVLTTLAGYSTNAANGSYGRLLFNANTNYTSNARRYLVTNALNARDFAIIRSVDALTTPTLDSSGVVTSGTTDFKIDYLGSVTIPGTGPHAIGGATNANAQWLFTGTHATTGTGRAVDISTTVSLAANQSGYGLIVSPTLVEAATGTHGDFASAIFYPPSITAGAASLTDASTLKITGAPTGGSNNYALWVAGGSVRMDGTGPHAIGGATDSTVQWYQRGAFTGASSAYAAYIATSLSPAANGEAGLLTVAGTINKAGSGTHADFVGLYLVPPTIGAGASTLTNASTLKITGAPTGATNNYALWSSGNTRWDSGYLKVSSSTAYLSLSGAYNELNQNADAANAALYIRHTAATATNQYGAQIILTGDPNDASRWFISCVGNATDRLVLRSNGGLANYSANDVNLSDATVKRDKGATADHTAFVKALSYRKFSYLDDQTDSDVDGLMAQDVQALDPSLVTEFSEGKLGIYTHRLQERINSIIPKLIQRIEALESQLQ